ncbi:uncharacterized protein LOC142328441 [Lycorma delicatula]|uniref:uncharacterized protein LOC142328441 n=1 Tax=Lycorma delicatula TaxID=130591 RepID=UPI003F519CBF
MEVRLIIGFSIMVAYAIMLEFASSCNSDGCCKKPCADFGTDKPGLMYYHYKKPHYPTGVIKEKMSRLPPKSVSETLIFQDDYIYPKSRDTYKIPVNYDCCGCSCDYCNYPSNYLYNDFTLKK